MISSNLHHLHNKCNKQAEIKISATSALQISHKLNLKRMCSSGGKNLQKKFFLLISPH